MAALRHIAVKFVVLLPVANLPISLAAQHTRYKRIDTGALGVPAISQNLGPAGTSFATISEQERSL